MRKIHLRDKQKNILLSILAVIIACIFLFPLYWIIVNSFKIDSEIFSSVPTLWPKKFTITAYKDLIGNLSVTLKKLCHHCIRLYDSVFSIISTCSLWAGKI